MDKNVEKVEKVILNIPIVQIWRLIKHLVLFSKDGISREESEQLLEDISDIAIVLAKKLS